MKSPLDSETLSPAVATLVREAQRSERSGQREIARLRYEAALYSLQSGEGAAASAIIRRIARTYVDEGQFDAALDCLVAALGIAEAIEDPDLIAHALNLTVLTHGQRGDLDLVEP